MIELIFLGTSSAFPTKKRNHPALFLRFKGDRFLFDCGEGTQRQLAKIGKSPMKLKSIFLTHWHGDHSLGLGGIIQSLSLEERKRDLGIYGPKRTGKRVKHLLKAFPFRLNFKIKTHSLDCEKPEKILETNDYKVKAVNIPHRARALVYTFKQKDKRKIDLEYTKKFGLVEHPKLGKLQKGKAIEWKGRKITPEKATYIKEGEKITYIGDGRPNKEVKEMAKDSDILISEATFSSKLKEKAKEVGHLTAKEAAKFAKEVGAGKLILTHFSRRYLGKRVLNLKREAEEVFENVKMAKDFMEL